MSDAVLQTIELVKAQVRDLEGQVAEKRRMVNSLCALIGQPPFYALTEAVTAESAGIVSGEFYGQQLATVVRKILEKRRIAKQGPASIGEIYDALALGDYAFETTNSVNAKRNLRISLTKNSSTFHKLPSGKYGLREWYPNIKDRKPNGAKSAQPEADELDEEEAEAAEFQEAFGSEPNASVDAVSKTTK